MTLTEYPDLIQGTDEWDDLRRGIVTASIVGDLITTRSLKALDYDCPNCGATANNPCRGKRAPGPIKTMHSERTAVAAEGRNTQILEVATGETARSVTALLVAERITGWTDPTFISDDMLRGITDEPLARDKYAEHYAPVTETGFMVREDQGVKLGYSPDGLVGDEGLIEIKSRKQKVHLATILSGKPPAENMPQLQCGLFVSGRKWIDYISFSGGMPLWVKRVYPDPLWFDVIAAAANALEVNAAEMIRRYNDEVAGLPLTERTIEMEMIL